MSESDSDEADSKAPAPAADEIRARALAFLARREHSAAEILRKLKQRGYPEDLIRPVLDALRSANQLSDDRYGEEFVRVHASRGQGPLKIQAALRQHGIDDAGISAALGSAGEDWSALARRVRIKRFGRVPPSDFAERARQARFLESRGFSAEQIRSALGDSDD